MAELPESNPYEPPVSDHKEVPTTSNARWVVYSQLVLATFSVLLGISAVAPGMSWASVLSIVEWPNIIVAFVGPPLVVFVLISAGKLRTEFPTLVVSCVLSVFQLFATYPLR